MLEVVTEDDALDLEVVAILHVAGRYPKRVGVTVVRDTWHVVGGTLTVPTVKDSGIVVLIGVVTV